MWRILRAQFKKFRVYFSQHIVALAQTIEEFKLHVIVLLCTLQLVRIITEDKVVRTLKTY